MSNNKSRQLARKSGGQNVFMPGSYVYSTEIDAQISDEERKRRVDFVIVASGCKNINLVFNVFLEILEKFESDPKLVDTVSRRIGLNKRMTISELVFYKKEYGERAKLKKLLLKQW
jgi:hypothetical protein